MRNFEENTLNDESMEKKKKPFIKPVIGIIVAVALVACVVTVVFMTNPSIRQKITGNKKTEEKTEEIDPTIPNAASYLKTLADYQNVEISASEVDEYVQDNIDQTLDNYATYKKVTKGKVKSGDTVNIHYVGKIDGEAFEGGSCTKEDTPDGFDLEIGSGSFIPGFEDALIGKKIGKTVDIDVTFPETYENNPDLAGKPAVFTVTINSKQGKKIIPELTDEFVKKNLTEYTSVKDYKESLKQSTSKSMALSKLVDDSEVKKYPKDKLKQVKKQLNTSITYYLTQYGSSLSAYLEQMGMTQEQYDEQVEKTAKDNVKKQLVLNAIAQAENLEVTKDQYNEALDTYLNANGCEKESDLDKVFKQQFGAEAKVVIYPDIIEKNVGDYIMDHITLK